MYELYVVTDRNISKRSHEEVAEASFRGGADVVQLRDKEMNSSDLLTAALKISKLSKEYGKLFIVNDRADIALASDADGLHIGQSDIPLRYAKRILPVDMIIGVSVSSVNEAKKAESGGADYVALSPVFNTSSKHDAGKGKGLKMLAEIRSAVKIPVIAIGGIDASNVHKVIEAGADGIAVISAVISEQDIVKAARNLKDRISELKASKVRQ